MRTRVLFLCVGNACRSQMAEAIARHLAADVIEPSSAGLVALGEITAPTLAVLGEIGISADGQYSKTLRPVQTASAELIVNMTCRPRAEIFNSRTPPAEDWNVGDPYGSNLSVYRAIRDEIAARVEDLARRLRESAPATAGAGEPGQKESE